MDSRFHSSIACPLITRYVAALTFQADILHARVLAVFRTIVVGLHAISINLINPLCCNNHDTPNVFALNKMESMFRSIRIVRAECVN